MIGARPIRNISRGVIMHALLKFAFLTPSRTRAAIVITDIEGGYRLELIDGDNSFMTESENYAELEDLAYELREKNGYRWAY